MNIKQLSVTFATIALAFACTKEPAPAEQTHEEQPIDTTTVINPPNPGGNPITHLPASAFTADTGSYYAIIYKTSNQGLHYHLEDKRLFLLNDTLRFGHMRLLPTSSTMADVLPFATSVLKTTSNGYTYYVDGRASGVVAFNNGKLVVSLKSVSNDSTSSNSSLDTYYIGNPAKSLLTREDYTGQYYGFITDAFGFGNTTTFTIEALPGTSNGVWLKEINQNAYINETGSLIIPESPVDSALYGPTVRYLKVETPLKGKLLRFGRQKVWGENSPSPSDYKSYAFFKE